jgi:uncharacterized protein YuzE
MRVTYDESVDAAYVDLTDDELPPGRDSVPVYQDVPDNVHGEVILDFRDGRLVGIEVLGASTTLPADLLAHAT